MAVADTMQTPEIGNILGVSALLGILMTISLFPLVHHYLSPRAFLLTSAYNAKKDATHHVSFDLVRCRCFVLSTAMGQRFCYWHDHYRLDSIVLTSLG
jgi:hypothetical protein